MTTPAPAPRIVPFTQAHADRLDALAAATAAIARHITGRQPGDEADALAALGLTDAQALMPFLNQSAPGTRARL